MRERRKKRAGSPGSGWSAESTPFCSLSGACHGVQPPDSPGLARDKILSLSRLRGLTVLPLTLECVHDSLDLCVEGGVTRQSYFDRQLAALMRRESIPVIVTENVRDFQAIDGITPVNPFA